MRRSLLRSFLTSGDFGFRNCDDVPDLVGRALHRGRGRRMASRRAAVSMKPYLRQNVGASGMLLRTGARTQISSGCYATIDGDGLHATSLLRIH
jgi:hypothetical protein